MTAIAIPIAPSSFEAQHDSFSRSPFSRSPFRQLSLSASSPNKMFTITSPSRDLPLDTKVVQAPSLPPTPPAVDQAPIVLDPRFRPTPIVPQAEPLPLVHSGSIVDNFRAALEGIDMEECEAHGENAFFVCDLGEVYRQHMRWMRELGARVQPFFGENFRP